MELRLQTARMLHDEHMAEVARLERLQRLLQRNGLSDPPDSHDSAVALLLADLISAFESQTESHFRFEEELLFPRLAEMGEAGIGELLTSEHKVIRELGVALIGLARRAQQDGFDPRCWREFRRLGLELVEQLTAHIEKEEMGLVPTLEQLLDDEQDSELALAYASSR